MIKKDMPGDPGGRVGRDDDRNNLGDASISKFKPDTESEQADCLGAIALAHIFVTRLGRVGLWIPNCPNCGDEHVHGGYPPYDIREGFSAANGWRAPHCKQITATSVGYRLTDSGMPARFAPGASRARKAIATMAWLKSIGLPTSGHEISSAKPRVWWRWL
jgi:hypothetical protein